MGKKCLKCGYERSVSDSAPDYECPKCGAIYAKVEAALLKVTIEENNASDKEKVDAIKKKAALEEQKTTKDNNPERDDSSKTRKETNANPKLAKCKTCGNDVSKSAQTCPHCGEKNPAPIQQLGCFPVIVVIVMFLWIIGKVSEPDGSSGTSSAFQAQVDCENFTKKQLKAPSSSLSDLPSHQSRQ